ncbi:hypothetical protein B0H14DRAFT_3522827 [Mycena olivaceomarginata]|nr:hypothetical protein B0H14DRAFT_3522827 [Mycena olivaceomarginata]
MAGVFVCAAALFALSVRSATITGGIILGHASAPTLAPSPSERLAHTGLPALSSNECPRSRVEATCCPYTAVLAYDATEQARSLRSFAVRAEPEQTPAGMACANSGYLSDIMSGKLQAASAVFTWRLPEFYYSSSAYSPNFTRYISSLRALAIILRLAHCAS